MNTSEHPDNATEGAPGATGAFGQTGEPVAYDAASERDIAVVSMQLGRQARGVLGIAARCACGNPTVVVTAPRLEDGTPFPTFFYLTHPAATIAMSRLEADGLMAEWQARLGDDAPFAAAYARAHAAYVAQRDAIERVDEISGVSAGGMPTRVKCLHALSAHALAAGPGVNPVGDLALAASSWSPGVCECADPGPHGAGDAVRGGDTGEAIAAAGGDVADPA